MTLEDTDCLVLLALRLAAHPQAPHYARLLALWQHGMGAAAECDFDVMQKARLFRYVSRRGDATAQRNALEVAARPLVMVRGYRDVDAGGRLVLPPAPE